MITSKQILEEIIGYVGKAVIYENPTSSDFLELYKASRSKIARFIIDNNRKKAYVWDAELTLHGLVTGQFGIPVRKPTFQGLLYGYGPMRSGKVFMSNADDLDDMLRLFTIEDKVYLRNLVKINWRWAYKYIDCTDYIHKIEACLR